MKKKIDTNKNFTHQILLNEVQKFCIKNKLDYIDGVVSWCEKNNVEIEQIANMIKSDPVFMSKLQFEAEELNFLEKPKRLPL